MILLAGLLGSDRSYFCGQTVLQNLVLDRPFIHVTTECDSFKVKDSLKARE